jgi:uncharacterized delta-60 repeat protein
MLLPGVLATTALLAAMSVQAQQVPGSLDSTFNGGAFDLQVGTGTNYANAVAVQHDGRIVVGGMTAAGTGSAWALVRRNADGTADTTFGGGSGQVILPVGGLNAGGATVGGLNAIVVQSNGKILGVGTGLDVTGAHANVDVVRWNTDGTLDAGFGIGGEVETDLGPNGSQGFAIAIQSNGKPVVVATQFDAPPGQQGEPVVIRYTSTGALDTSFASGGIFHLPTSVPASSRGWGTAIALQPDGMILVGSSTMTRNNAVLLRVTAAGLLDPAFGVDILPSSQTSGSVQAITVSPDGRILCVAGALYQVLANGSPDTTFGEPVAQVRYGWTHIVGGRALLRLPTGRSRVTTTRVIGNPEADYFYTQAFNQVGRGDGSFGAQPVAFSPSHTATMGILAMALQPDGRFVVAGVDAQQFLVARFVGNPLVLRPQAFSFPSVTGVPTSTLQTSNAITVAGLTSDKFGAAYVPIYVSGGSYSINGGAFTTALGYATNNDSIVVQHTSAATSGTSMTTTLRIGGLNTPTAPWVVNGTLTAGTFTSTTQ